MEAPRSRDVFFLGRILLKIARDESRLLSPRRASRTGASAFRAAEHPSYVRAQMYTRKHDRLCPRKRLFMPPSPTPTNSDAAPKAIITRKSHGSACCSFSNVPMYVHTKCMVSRYLCGAVWAGV